MASGAFPILVFAPANVCDAVLASGLVRRLHEEIPNAAFTIVAEPRTAALFSETPGLEQVVAGGRGGFGAALDLWSRLRRRKWGLILDSLGGRLAGWLPAVQRAVRRPGEAAPAHKVLEAARLLKLEDDPPAPFLFTSLEQETQAANLIGDDGPVLAIAPSTEWLGSTWPAERYARVAVQLLGEGGALEGGRLLIVGGPQDWPAAEALSRSIPRERRIDLTAAAFDPLVIYACLKRVRLFLGGAGLWTLMAAAAGAPTLGLYGPTDEAVEGPWGPNARVVRGPRSFEAIKAQDPKLNQPVCHMLDLPVETVLEGAVRLLAETKTEIPEPMTSRRHA